MKVNRNDAVKFLIDKMLSTKGIDNGYNYVIANPKINGVDWYRYYSWSEEEEQEFKKFFIDFLTKRVYPRYPLSYAKSQWGMFNLMYGLSTKKNESR